MSDSNEAVAPVQVQLTVSGILGDLKNGLTRDHIKAKYSLSGKDLAELFSHPKLKGKKTQIAPGFVLTDDTAEETIEATQEVVETQEETQESVTENNVEVGEEF